MAQIPGLYSIFVPACIGCGGALPHKLLSRLVISRKVASDGQIIYTLILPPPTGKVSQLRQDWTCPRCKRTTASNALGGNQVGVLTVNTVRYTYLLDSLDKQILLLENGHQRCAPLILVLTE